MRPLFVITIILLVGQPSCRTRKPEDRSREVIGADLAFSDQSSREGRNRAFLAWCADDGVLLRSNSYPLEGKVKIQELLSRPDTSYILTWKPMYGYVAESGELGYTYGTWELTVKATGVRSEGTYSTVWKKDKTGAWRWVLDTGNEGLKEN
ncbi:MAG: hypothetical protein A2X22_00605 [Bacteroidetes bacterium GWF2_49_14]|nr:MAG: hypothetical protein A2X22_00605 [Bacteroidetes bacterium GWF2_49_14]HBB92314.1 hypothetical protein [Bacteroidales bacterium]